METKEAAAYNLNDFLSWITNEQKLERRSTGSMADWSKLWVCVVCECGCVSVWVCGVWVCVCVVCECVCVWCVSVCVWCVSVCVCERDSTRARTCDMERVRECGESERVWREWESVADWREWIRETQTLQPKSKTQHLKPHTVNPTPSLCILNPDPRSPMAG